MAVKSKQDGSPSAQVAYGLRQTCLNQRRGRFKKGSFLGVTQEQTAGVKHTAAQEGRAGQCCDKPSEQQPEGGLGQALRGLRLPTQEETKQHLQKFMAQQ
ncbi:hypothetical protein WJX77_004347 [Trebouxia sp. C0004]